MIERIATRSGLDLVVEKRPRERQVELSLRTRTSRRCILHWGLRSGKRPDWQVLPRVLWPEGTLLAGGTAMETPFKKENGECRVAITVPASLERGGGATAQSPDVLEFVLFFPDEARWDNNSRRNYQISICPPSARSSVSLPDALKVEIDGEEVVMERVFELGEGRSLAAAVTKSNRTYRVLLLSDLSPPLILHWGIARRSPHEWLQPSKDLCPPDTKLIESHTAQTPFAESGTINSLILNFPEETAPLGLQFVLKQGADGRWINYRGSNFFVPIHTPLGKPGKLKTAELEELSQQIIRAEMGPGSWTLMHRFNLCYDLLDRARGNVDALALLYVWLRFSAIRQLTWQRNYNTKPRELAHAQDRLTHKLGEVYASVEANGRPLLRLMLATIGRGGDGQRIRDEVLQIMHRHHIKEVSGHFMEEWHQKLHNNTTPDDVVICEGYLEFLRSNGNLDRFYERLREGGVTRERLEKFERPIRTHPDFVPHLKGALIHDFEEFLKVLKAVHSGTDLETAMNAARNCLDGEIQGRLWHVWEHRNDPQEALVPLVGEITDVRRRLYRHLQQGESLRALLYLDLALEQLIRVLVERNLHQHLGRDALVNLVALVLENVTLSDDQPELSTCLRQWERLQGLPRFSPPWSLHANSVVDRISRALAEWTDHFYRLLQPKAELLGRAFKAEAWTITLFSEEVVRGSSLGFALSMLLRQLGRALRTAANLGAWQIVSRGSGTGQVEVVNELRSVQGKSLGSATVIVAEKVTGEEELPPEIVAVIAPDVTDLVSHVAVRARNAQVLFASCSDPALLDRLKSLRGRQVHVEVTAAGDVVFEEDAKGSIQPAVHATRRAVGEIPRPVFSRFVLSRDQFDEKSVGAKSLNQTRLRGKLPQWVRQPVSVALPFGVFEKVLLLAQNTRIAKQYEELVRTPSEHDKLAKIRETVQSLAAPEELKTDLREAFHKNGLAWPENWDSVWCCITQVWASKWNERAVLSRNHIGLRHEDLFMAVLIQPVIEADYAFVIHTANPSTGNRDELYAEIVLGLGETLVGNYPGRALSFVWDKKASQPRVLTFPSKSIGLYGSGLIFRSDSNGEDLGGYAGAGLYDSVLLNPPRQTRLDYSNEPLIWDEEFRNGMLRSIADIGLAAETALGSAQDIEGAVSKGRYFVVQSRPQI